MQERRGGHASARIALQSLDFAEVRDLQVSGDWDGAARLLSEAARTCERAGADVVLIASNLMHRVADEVEAALAVPLLRVTDALADRAHQQGWTRLGVLATRWVMEEDFYLGRLERAGLETLVPGPEDRAEVDRVIFEELTLGHVHESSRTTYAALAARLAAEGAEAIVLGCTEIELLLRAQDTSVPLLDTMRVHAEAAADLALA